MTRVTSVACALLLTVLRVTSHALIIPPDPFDATDRYALLFPNGDGSITQVEAKLQLPVRSGFLIGEVSYRHEFTPKGFPIKHHAVSRPIPMETLSLGVQALVTFDFSSDPLPDSSRRRTLSIYLLNPDNPVPELLAEYPGERLLLRPAGAVTETDLVSSQTAESGELIVGPLTIMRERGTPQTETIRFDLSDANGVFFLRLTNGDADSRDRVAAAVVTLNGHNVFRPSEFNRKVAGLTRQISVRPGENVIEVTIRSAPGAQLTVEVVRQDGRFCRVLGPMTFERTTGKPETEEVVFPLGAQLSGPFTLRVINGDDERRRGHGYREKDHDRRHRVDSGVISLNGETVIHTSDFREDVTEISRIVTLQSANTLRVKLKGMPGDWITLEIMGFDNVAPQVAITSPVPGAVVAAGPITVMGVVDDPSAIVTVNGVVATVAPDGTFTAEGVPIQEGDNSITVIAVDSCGNQGEASVTVRLQTTPVGPELLFCAEDFREQRPMPPITGCADREVEDNYGVVVGTTDDTAVSITINGVLLPDGVQVLDQGAVLWGMREGTFFWAWVYIPPPDGEHLYTAVVTDAAGQSRSATVTYLRDTIDPEVVITSPANEAVFNTTTITITGTVDDPETEGTVVSVNSIPSGAVVNGQFSVTVSLPGGDGVSTFRVLVRDFAGNSGVATLQVIRDRTPPTLTLMAPVEGAVINTPMVSMVGTVADRNFAVSVAAAANGRAPTPLIVSGFDFSGLVGLDAGANTLEIVARDEAGNTSTVTRSVVLDLVPPNVRITAPSRGASLSGSVTVTADAADDVSGIAQVSLVVDGQGYSTRTIAPYVFTLDTIQLAAGDHTFTARTTDRAGNLSEDAIAVNIQPQIQMQITSPSNGSTVPYSLLLVRGVVATNTPELGITVNGYVAEAHAGQFAVDGVALEPGANTLTATASDGAGVVVTATASVAVAADAGEPPVKLDMVSANRLAPASVVLDAQIESALPIASFQVDFEGDGVVDLAGTTWSKITWTYANAGLYFPTLTVHDTHGSSYTVTTVLRVWDSAALDALLQERWTAMRDAASVGDLDEALEAFLPESRDRFRTIFLDLGDSLSPILASIEEVHLLAVTSYAAEAESIRTEDGIPFSYPMTYRRDANGLWKLKRF